MNVFAALAEPIRSRPGDAQPASVRARPVRGRPRLAIPASPVLENPWSLNGHECAIVIAIVNLKTSKDIAQDMGLSFKTVETYVVRLREKMNARSSLEAALMWDRFIRQENL